MLHKGCNKMRVNCCVQTNAYICYYHCVCVCVCVCYQLIWTKSNFSEKWIYSKIMLNHCRYTAWSVVSWVCFPDWQMLQIRINTKQNNSSSVLEKKKIYIFLFFINVHICTFVPKFIAASTKETKTGNGTADFAVWVLQSRECGRHLGHCRPCENRSALSLIEYVSPISLAGWAWLVLPAQKVL